MIGILFSLFLFASSAIASLEPCENVGQLKPDTENCNNFYQCTNNGWVLLYCQPPTLFNPKILNCDWPANVECAKPSLLQALAPCENVGQLKPDPENCAGFYQCTNSGWAPLLCQPPTLFNPKILNCDWPQNVDC
ncbi:hypothetical protein WA026_018656 [Henosepilachna vigintioctopunctata]|uniref:Chitin-binding type-2 domain-containing protein n=1 Tax=Henosepilachna vigintioctopunctata TaxID=420089 RepID=A0AAW1U3P4_9CUCU